MEKENWEIEYCKKFGLCDQNNSKCQCKKELDFIRQQRTKAIEEFLGKLKETTVTTGSELERASVSGHNEAIREIKQLALQEYGIKV